MSRPENLIKSIQTVNLDSFPAIYKKGNDFKTFAGKPTKGYKKVSNNELVSLITSYLKTKPAAEVERPVVKKAIQHLAKPTPKSKAILAKIGRAVSGFMSIVKNAMTFKGFHTTNHLTIKRAEALLKNQKLTTDPKEAEAIKQKEALEKAQQALKDAAEAEKAAQKEKEELEQKMAQAKIEEEKQLEQQKQNEADRAAAELKIKEAEDQIKGMGAPAGEEEAKAQAIEKQKLEAQKEEAEKELLATAQKEKANQEALAKMAEEKKKNEEIQKQQELDEVKRQEELQKKNEELQALEAKQKEQELKLAKETDDKKKAELDEKQRQELEAEEKKKAEAEAEAKQKELEEAAQKELEAEAEKKRIEEEAANKAKVKVDSNSGKKLSDSNKDKIEDAPGPQDTPEPKQALTTESLKQKLSNKDRKGLNLFYLNNGASVMGVEKEKIEEFNTRLIDALATNLTPESELNKALEGFFLVILQKPSDTERNMLPILIQNQKDNHEFMTNLMGILVSLTYYIKENKGDRDEGLLEALKKNKENQGHTLYSYAISTQKPLAKSLFDSLTKDTSQKGLCENLERKFANFMYNMLSYKPTAKEQIKPIEAFNQLTTAFNGLGTSNALVDDCAKAFRGLAANLVV